MCSRLYCLLSWLYIVHCSTFLGSTWTYGLDMSADMAVDPGGELADPGVNSRQVRSTTAQPPAHNANEEPAAPTRLLARQRSP